LYKSIYRSILTYAAPVWSDCATTHLKKLQIVENKILRIILNAKSYTKITKLHEDANTAMLTEFIKKLKENFSKKINYSKNPLFKDLIDK
jgi:hypothetical protein